MLVTPFSLDLTPLVNSPIPIYDLLNENGYQRPFARLASLLRLL